MPLAPRQATIYTSTEKALLRSLVGVRSLPGIIDDSERDMDNTGYEKILRPGNILGHNSSTLKWYIIWATKLSADEAAAQTTLSVTAADGNTHFTASDPDGSPFNVKIVGPGGMPAEFDCGAIVSVAANTITITNALPVGYPSGSYVYRAPATGYGQCIAQGILFEEASVDDGMGGDADASIIILTHGIVDESELLNATDLQIGQLRDATVGDIAHVITFE